MGQQSSHDATFYVVFDAEIGGTASWQETHVRKVKARRISQNPPSLAGGEVALKFKANIPDAAFLRLIPNVEITIPDGWWTSQAITVDVQEQPEET
jgi:hypothetical protein